MMMSQPYACLVRLSSTGRWPSIGLPSSLWTARQFTARTALHVGFLSGHAHRLAYNTAHASAMIHRHQVQTGQIKCRASGRLNLLMTCDYQRLPDSWKTLQSHLLPTGQPETRTPSALLQPSRVEYCSSVAVCIAPSSTVKGVKGSACIQPGSCTTECNEAAAAQKYSTQLD